MNQQNEFLLKLRTMILDGTFAPGERLREAALAERLHVSRTPVREALGVLENEGLVLTEPTRGCRVREFSLKDIIDAIEVRGVLESLAARAVAARPLPAQVRTQLMECLARGDALLDRGQLGEGDEKRYADMNADFHDVIVGAAGNPALANAIALNNNLPFAAAASVTLDIRNHAVNREQFRLLHYSHTQHHAIVQALVGGQSARAEGLMREHVYVAIENVKRIKGAQVGIAAA